MQETSFNNQSCSPLEERDYIGLSDALSAIASTSKEDAGFLLKDTDLRLDLGLGLGLGYGCEQEGHVTQPANKEALSKTPFLTQRTSLKRLASEIGRKQSSMQGSMALSDICSCESPVDYAPPSKERIVGWPPVRFCRKQKLCKPSDMFVKVNMDGMTVGRKVDLSAFGSYKSLLLALEEMFRPAGRDSDINHFLSSPDYVLTYEDKEGDWMLVGDVPWSLFTAAVRRLRITHVLQANATDMLGATS